MPEELVVIGGGEHARVVIDAAMSSNDKWNVLGFVDPDLCKSTSKLMGVKRLGDDKIIPKLQKSNPKMKFILGIGVSGSKRKQLFSKFKIPLYSWGKVIHSSAIVAPSAKIMNGVTVLAGAIIQPGAYIGKHSIINTKSTVEHDCYIENYSHIAPGVITGGGVTVGEGSLIGIGARLKDHITIGKNATVGSGSVVIADISENDTVIGVPAKRISATPDNFDIHDLCISKESSIYEAMSIINKYGKLVAFVTDSDFKLLGIVMDSDIRKGILKDSDLNKPVRQFMKEDYLYVTNDTSRSYALDYMKACNISTLPIIDSQKKLIGLHTLFRLIGNNDIPNIAVIMAGGKGTRLRPITNSIPKPMVKVAGRPILEHIILHLSGHGIKHIYISVNYKAEIIRNYFDSGEKFGCEIKYLNEDIPLGTAGALNLLPPLEHEIILMNGDLVTQVDIQNMLIKHQKQKNAITVGAKMHINQIPYGVLNIECERVKDISEKPEFKFLVNGGIYIINPEILEFIPKNMEYNSTDLIIECLNKKLKVGYHHLDDDWIDVGEHSQLNKALGI